MKIALVVPGGVDRSGVDRVIPAFLWLIERLARRHDVHVFALQQEPDPGDWGLLGASVHNIGTASGTANRLLNRFGVEHRRAPFHVVHAFFGPCAAYAACLRWRYRVRVVFHATGGEFVSLPNADYGMGGTFLGRVARRLALIGASRVTVPSVSMQHMAAAHGVTTTLVPLGVALDRWPIRQPQMRDTSRPVRLLHIGDLRPVKDQETLMKAAVALRHADVDFELDMVGFDTMNGALQRSVETRKLGTRVRWHGVLGREPLRARVEQADILVLSSRHEAEPLVVLEAAIAGVPTVGTAVGHVAEWAPTAAVAVPVRDAAGLAREIAALAADEPRRLAIAHEAQRRAIAIDADFTASAFERCYAELA